MSHDADTVEFPVYLPSKVLKASIPIPRLLKDLARGDPIPKNVEGEVFHILRIMLPEYGDKRYSWNPRSIPEINEARDTFNACVREGLIPYRVGTDGNPTSEVMDEFDISAGEVIFVPIRAVTGG